MADSKLSEMISSSLESIRTIADSGTVVGDPHHDKQRDGDNTCLKDFGGICLRGT